MKKDFSIKEINNVVKEIFKILSSSNLDEATVVTLSGDLGAGKTTLTQGIAREFGIKEKVVSPTFVIIKKYKIKNPKWETLVHIDAYRLEKNEEMLNLGWQEIIQNPKNLVFLEWPEKISKIIPNKITKIKLRHHKESEKRHIEIKTLL